MKRFLAGLIVAGCFGGSAQAAFDTFDTLDPAWQTDRYAPQSFNVDGLGHLKIEISNAQGAANRGGQSGAFYNTQGMQKPASGSSPWVVSADLFVSADMLSGENLRRTDLWIRNDDPNEATADYGIIGLRRFDPDHPFDPGSSLSTVWRIWDADTANGWVDLATSVNAGWNNLAIAGDATSYSYFINGVLVYTDNTVDLTFRDLQTVFLQAYNFSDGLGTYGDQGYSVLWDNLSAGSVPEAASIAVWGGFGACAMAVGFWRKKRAVKA